MVLRAGIILPFQFQDIKKLLMVGSPEEERDLKLFDFTNVVRAAFNIYNFEFRNKQIDFQIPDELLIHYLEQCKDLTNFVIQIDQASHANALLASTIESVEPSCSQLKTTLYLQKPLLENESSAVIRNNFTTIVPRSSGGGDIGAGGLSSPLGITSHNEQSLTNNPETPIKLRRVQFFADRTPESFTQSIDPNDLIPKTEQDETELSLKKDMQQQQQQQQQILHITQQTPHVFQNYAHTLLGNTQQTAGPLNVSTHHSPLMHNMSSRFRRRGERMSKDQKELYVKFFEENPCMLQQRRNDAALSPLWSKLASMLNNVQQGAVKNVEEWKQTFDAWRYRVFMYSRYNSKLTSEEAHNPKNYKPLTHTDQRAYAMWTSHRNSTANEYEKMEIFPGLEESQTDDYDY